MTEDAGMTMASLGFLQWCLLIVTAIWIGIALYELVLRRAHNLTRAESAQAKGGNDLDFLKKDPAARRQALDAADAYARQLGSAPGGREKISRLKQVFAAFSAIIAVLTLIGVIAGTLARLEHTGELLKKAGLDRLTDVVEQYPVGTGLSALVIGYHILAFFVFRKWKGEKL